MAPPIDFGDDHLVPILGFAEGSMRDRLLLPGQGGGSGMHEFIPGIVEEVFSFAPEAAGGADAGMEASRQPSGGAMPRGRRKHSTKSMSGRALKRTQGKRRAV